MQREPLLVFLSRVLSGLPSTRAPGLTRYVSTARTSLSHVPRMWLTPLPSPNTHSQFRQKRGGHGSVLGARGSECSWVLEKVLLRWCAIGHLDPVRCGGAHECRVCDCTSDLLLCNLSCGAVPKSVQESRQQGRAGVARMARPYVVRPRSLFAIGRG